MSRNPPRWNPFDANRKFSEHQLNSLQEFGLLPEQIESLERLLPECAFAVRKRSTRTDLDSELQAIENPLMEAREALAALRAQRSVAADEALLRIRLVDATLLDKGTGSADEVLEHAIDRALKILSVARSLRRAEQERNKTAMLFPIGQIAAALEEGYRREFERADTAPSKYKLTVSRSGNFRDIVALCYEAIGLPETDPDRAIRTYLEGKKARKEQRPADLPKPKRSATGRQVKKKS
ncbi:hypothetical protein [Steroidobacter agaridevorans]|nr:hypothetical protein [Steroidobacter agaridevorans]